MGLTEALLHNDPVLTEEFRGKSDVGYHISLGKRPYKFYASDPYTAIVLGERIPGLGTFGLVFKLADGEVDERTEERCDRWQTRYFISLDSGGNLHVFNEAVSSTLNHYRDNIEWGQTLTPDKISYAPPKSTPLFTLKVASNVAFMEPTTFISTNLENLKGTYTEYRARDSGVSYLCQVYAIPVKADQQVKFSHFGPELSLFRGRMEAIGVGEKLVIPKGNKFAVYYSREPGTYDDTVTIETWKRMTD